MKKWIIAIVGGVTLVLASCAIWYFVPNLRARNFSFPADPQVVLNEFGVISSDGMGSLGITLGKHMTTYDLKQGRLLRVHTELVGGMSPTSRWVVTGLSVDYDLFQE